MSQQKPEAPQKEYRAGTICAAIWRKEATHQGRKLAEQSIRIQKPYIETNPLASGRPRCIYVGMTC